MENNKQLYEKIGNEYKEVFPLNFIENIVDKVSGKTLAEIIASYNNIYVPYKGTAEATRNAIPVLLRRRGLWISYNVEDKSITEKYIGTTQDVTSNWANDDNWEKIPDVSLVQVEAGKLPDGIITPSKLSPALQQLINEHKTIYNLPDDEDLEEVNGVIRFKDREYNPLLDNSKGYKILRRNWIGGKNVLTQEMINDVNTIYEIRYDFDLNGQEITIPEGCVLDFKGGSLSNGVIVGNDTKINYFNNNIINIKFKRKFKTDFIYLDKKNDIESILNSFICKKIILNQDINARVLNINNKYINIEGNNNNLYCNSIIIRSEKLYIYNLNINIKNISNLENTQFYIFSNIINIDNCNFTTSYLSIATYMTCRNCNYVNIINSNFETNKNIPCLYLYDCNNVNIDDNKFLNSQRGIHVIGTNQANGNLLVKNNIIINCDGGIIFNGGLKYNINIINNILKNTGVAGAESSAINIHGYHSFYIDNNKVFDCIGNIIDIDNSINDVPQLNKFGNILNCYFKSDMGNIITYFTDDIYLYNNIIDINKFTIHTSNTNYINNYIKYKNNGYNVVKFSNNFHMNIINNILNTNLNHIIFDFNILVDNVNLDINILNNKTINKQINQISYMLRNKTSNRIFNINSDCNPYDERNLLNSNISINTIKYLGNNGIIFFDGLFNRFLNGDKIDYLKIGKFIEKPKNDSYNNLRIGYEYFCTDKQTTEGATNGIMIYHKGNNVWVDALGRVIE